jgi:hypothetical protein
VRWVGVLAGGPDAALCRPSAPELGGLRGFESPVSAKLDPRRTTMPFSVIAMTSKARKVERAHHILASAAQQRLIRTSDVRAALGCRPDVRLRALMLESLVDIDDGAQSLNEIALKRLISRSRLPPAELQIRTATRRRRSRLAGGWPAYGVAFESTGPGTSRSPAGSTTPTATTRSRSASRPVRRCCAGRASSYGGSRTGWWTRRWRALVRGGWRPD